jgi:hypothetical protein
MREKNNGCKSPLSEFMFVWINVTYSENVTDITDTYGSCLSNASAETLVFTESNHCDIFLIFNDGVYPQQWLLFSSPLFS